MILVIMHYDYPCMRGYACALAVFTALVLALSVKTRPYRITLQNLSHIAEIWHSISTVGSTTLET